MTEYKFTANYQLVEEQPIVISFDKLHKELYDKGWTVHWEFNGGAIDPALLKYNHCITVDDCATVNPEYAYDVDGNGAWNYRLDNLKNADGMFVVGEDEETMTIIGSPALVSFNADLPKLTGVESTFAGCSNLTTFNGDLSNLSECLLMFANCPKLKSFTSDLSSLIMTMFMFGSNYETAERFVYDVMLGDVDPSQIPSSYIEQYVDMIIQQFGSPTSLDVASVQNIANTINDITGLTPPDDLDTSSAFMWGRVDIGIDPTLEGNSDIETALTTIRNKGWDVTPMYYSGIYTPTPGEGLLKYNDCRTSSHCMTIDANVATDVDENGAWNYYLDNLKTGDTLFEVDGENTSLVSFNVDLPKLTNGYHMFVGCTNLTSFSSNLSALTDGSAMFSGCTALTSFSSDLPNLTDGGDMFNSCSGLTEWNTPLPNLTDGGGMFYGCVGLTEWNTPLPNLTDGLTMFRACTNLTSFSSNLSALTDGRYMFLTCRNLTSFSSDLSALTDGTYMFDGCKNLTEWNTPLPNLTKGSDMFSYCEKLTSFSVDLPKLTSGGYMFQGCENLTSFSSNLSNLTSGTKMFSYCEKLTSFSADLPKLTNGTEMFDGCENLTSFNSDLSSLTNGTEMFNSCDRLASFTSNLSNLTSGSYMFGVGSNSYCTRLNLASVQHIANTINDLTGKTSDGTEGWGQISIGMQKAIQGNADLATALAAIRAKGWTVAEMYRN